MSPPGRWHRIPPEVRAAAAIEAGEHLLGWAGDPPLVATSWGLWMPGEQRLDWDDIDHVGWSPPTLAVVPSGGLLARTARLTEPGDLPDLVRAEVDLSLVFSRRESLRPLPGGVRLVGRRSPRSGDLRWQVLFEGSADAADPEVSGRARELLRLAQQELAG